jgi:hypothetical protein
MFVKFDPLWFQSYCRAVVEDDREAVRKQFPIAKRAIRKALRSSMLSKADRQALREALRYLDITKTPELKKPSRGTERRRLSRKSA